MLTISLYKATCVISSVRRFTLSPTALALTNARDPRCGRPLCVGNALGDRKDRVASVPDRSISTILPGAPKADLLLT